VELWKREIVIARQISIAGSSEQFELSRVRPGESTRAYYLALSTA
jgi:hypothetical protein